MPIYDTATPYIACYVLLEKDSRVAFVLRSGTSWMNNYYGLPSGKVEIDETFTAGAIREAKEEIGVDIKSSDLEPILTVHRKASDGAPYWVDIYFRAKNWEGEPFNAEPHMHSELAWLDPKQLPDNVIPSVKSALEEIVAGKIYSEFGW